MNLLLHAGNANQRVIDGAETHQIEMGVVLILNGVCQYEIFINSVCHELNPP
jgi:hypothetical protein